MTPTVKPAWRTATVLDLCRAVLQTHDVSALPVLADALQEAGCDDEELLTRLRTERGDVAARRLVNLVYADETARAVAWLEQLADQFAGRHDRADDEDDADDAYYAHVNYAYLVRAGYDLAEGGEFCFNTNAGANFFRAGEANVREFFHNWSLVTGVPVPVKKAQKRMTFRCSC